MRILHVYKSYPPTLGGIELHVRVLAEAAAERGHAVTVLVASPDRRAHEEQRRGVRIVRVPRRLEIASTPIAPQLLAAARRLGREADLVHLHAPHPPGELAHLLGGPHVRTVLTYQSDIVRQRLLGSLYRPLLRRLLARCDRVVVTSDRYRDSSPVLAGVRDRCVTIPLGVDVERFAPRGDAGAVQRRRLGAAATDPLLLFVGRLRWYKGIDVLLRALPEVPGARLAIVGAGPMEARWRRLAAALGLGARATFLGEVDEATLPACYHAADVFVLPSSSRAEAFGTVLLEAMAAALPCVTTELGTATSWVVRDGLTGLVVPPNDPPALAAALRDLLADPERRRRLGAGGAARVRREFDVRTMIDAVLALYAEIAPRAGS